jgi:hypothetical protein
VLGGERNLLDRALRQRRAGHMHERDSHEGRTYQTEQLLHGGSSSGCGLADTGWKDKKVR